MTKRKTGIDLLRDAAEFADEACACNRDRCRACRLRREIADYLRAAAPAEVRS